MSPSQPTRGSGEGRELHRGNTFCRHRKLLLHIYADASSLSNTWGTRPLFGGRGQMPLLQCKTVPGFGFNNDDLV